MPSHPLDLKLILMPNTIFGTWWVTNRSILKGREKGGGKKNEGREENKEKERLGFLVLGKNRTFCENPITLWKDDI